MAAPDREEQEIVSYGFDEYLQTVGGDPQGSPTSIGLRVPALAGVRYLFLGARADLDAGDAIVGYRQLATLGFAQPSNLGSPSAAPLLPRERSIVSPEFHLPDGFISWHLMAQPKRQATAPRRGPHDQESFAFEDASSPALLYETAHFPTVPTTPGYLGLDAYSPPAMLGVSQLTLRDIRGPWDRTTRFHLPIRRPTSIRFYIAVLQSNPATRLSLAITPSDFVIAGLEVEDNFLQAFPSSVYWRVGVGLLIERASRKRG